MAGGRYMGGMKRNPATLAMTSTQQKMQPGYMSPYASDPSSESYKAAHGLQGTVDWSKPQTFAGPEGAFQSASAGAPAGGAAMSGANPQAIADMLRRMNGGGSGVSGQGGFNFGQQTELGGGAGAGDSVMGQMGGAAQSAGGAGRRMYAGGSPTFNESAGSLNRSMYPPATGAAGSAGQQAPGQFIPPWGQFALAGGGNGWSGFGAPAAQGSGYTYY